VERLGIPGLPMPLTVPCYRVSGPSAVQTPTHPKPSTGQPVKSSTVSVFGLSHVGRVRRRNEDSVLAFTLGATTRVWASNLEASQADWERAGAHELPGDAPLVLAVADGVGGGPGGQEASRLTLTALPDLLREALSAMDEGQEAEPLLRAAVLALHRRLKDAGSVSPELGGMATTLTVWIGSGPNAWLVQVGDSRCYRLRNGRLSQLTVDQTMAQDMVEQGQVKSLEDAPQICQNILTSALGGMELHPRIDHLDRQPGDVILVCSDGVMKHIPDDGIETWLSTDISAEEIARGLVDAAVEEGGHDNVSAIVAREAG